MSTKLESFREAQYQKIHGIREEDKNEESTEGAEGSTPEACPVEVDDEEIEQEIDFMEEFRQLREQTRTETAPLEEADDDEMEAANLYSAQSNRNAIHVPVQMSKNLAQEFDILDTPPVEKGETQVLGQQS